MVVAAAVATVPAAKAQIVDAARAAAARLAVHAHAVTTAAAASGPDAEGAEETADVAVDGPAAGAADVDGLAVAVAETEAGMAGAAIPPVFAAADGPGRPTAAAETETGKAGAAKLAAAAARDGPAAAGVGETEVDTVCAATPPACETPNGAVASVGAQTLCMTAAAPAHSLDVRPAHAPIVAVSPKPVVAATTAVIQLVTAYPLSSLGIVSGLGYRWVRISLALRRILYQPDDWATPKNACLNSHTLHQIAAACLAEHVVMVSLASLPAQHSRHQVLF